MTLNYINDEYTAAFNRQNKAEEMKNKENEVSQL